MATGLSALPGVKSVTRHAELQVLAVRQPEMLAVSLRGTQSVRRR